MPSQPEVLVRSWGFFLCYRPWSLCDVASAPVYLCFTVCPWVSLACLLAFTFLVFCQVRKVCFCIACRCWPIVLPEQLLRSLLNDKVSLNTKSGKLHRLHWQCSGFSTYRCSSQRKSSYQQTSFLSIKPQPKEHKRRSLKQDWQEGDCVTEDLLVIQLKVKTYSRNSDRVWELKVLEAEIRMLRNRKEWG